MSATNHVKGDGSMNNLLTKTTVRELIHKANEIKMSCLEGFSIEQVVQTTHLSIIVHTMNETRLLITMHPKGNLKKGVYRKIDFEILKGEYVAPEELWNYGSRWTHNSNFLAHFSDVPEKTMNHFLSINGGVNLDKFIQDFTNLWESFEN